MNPLQPGATIGILGGGQLGRMLSFACAKLGFKAHIYAPDADSPAFQASEAHTVAAYDDEAALSAFAKSVDVVTFEFENIPVKTVEFIAGLKPVQPSPRVLATTQDRFAEKNFVRDLGLAVAPFDSIAALPELESAIKTIGTPCVLKTRRFGYDGKGQAKIENENDAAKAWKEIGGAPAILESFIDLRQEVSVIAARSASGEVATYDLIENVHRNHILHTASVPARTQPAIAEQARNAAVKIANAFDYAGVMAVEFFIDTKGQLLVNEIAPRVHNSGHWTLDACAVTQFENHIRAIAGWSLGSTERFANAVITNLIGDAVNKWQSLAAEKGASLWLYGKSEARPGRKMGHVTRLSPKA